MPTQPTSNPSGVSPAMDSLLPQLLQCIRPGANPSGREAVRKYMEAKTTTGGRNRGEERTLPMSHDLSHISMGFPYLLLEKKTVHQKSRHWSRRSFQKWKSIFLALFSFYPWVRAGSQEICFILPKSVTGSQYVWEHVSTEQPGDTKPVRWLMG